MTKNRLINQEKGSIAVYAIATVLSFIFILGGIYFTSSVVRKNQLRTMVKIKEIYSRDIGRADEIANSLNQYVQEGLVLHYDGINNTGDGHNDTATIWTDLSGNGNDGIISGTANWQSDSMYLNGSSYIKSKNEVNFGVKTWEILLSPENTNAFFLDQRVSEVGYQPCYLRNTFKFQYYNNASGGVESSSTISQTKQLISIAQDTNTVKIYINGRLVESYNMSYVSSGSGNIYIGVRHTLNTGFLKGKVYSVRVYDQALTDAQISQNYGYDYLRYIKDKSK